MSERPVTISDDIAARQHRAANPKNSAWVTANAGSGKTHVLTQRVLRLLLSGVSPEAMLCLTYTKAAAAEMRGRVARDLAGWATLPEDDLRGVLLQLEDAPPDADKLSRARTLFAHALDSPGGLKINTIHAFCESVLHRFPLEAGVPLGFTVIEEADATTRIKRATESVLAEGLNSDDEIAEAVGVLFARLSDSAIETAIKEALAQGRELRHVLPDSKAAKANLRALTGYDPARSESAIMGDAVSGLIFTRSEAETLFVITPPGDGTRFEDKVGRLDFAALRAGPLFSAFLNKDGSAPARSNAKKDVRTVDPALADAIDRETERLAGLQAELQLAMLIERSEALLDVLAAIVGRYESAKRASSLMDFDDLVERLVALLSDEEQRHWVMYKLDAAITHVLVDESQDTNPEQWSVVTSIADDFFSGQGAVERPRTVFAVGDRKQSVYSFQGAEPRLFGATGEDFERRAKNAGQRWDDVTLKASFRTLPGILEAVDRVTARADIKSGLLTEAGEDGHDSARRHKGGTVTLWPVIATEEGGGLPEEWPTDVREAGKSAPRQLAERIAGQIGGWIRTKRPLGQRKRAVRASDVLVLVQSRGELFHEIIRALKLGGIATPGADRLNVTSHIAVLDLLALGDVLLNPADDLQLAALLRSPLFDLSEDQLYAVCAGRPEGQSVWQALSECGVDRARAAYERLSCWRARLDFERVFEFFAHVLYAEGGLKGFHARLGTEVDDVLAEFLDLALAQERESQPSLQGFLSEMRRREVQIKRELTETGGGVRVMTVHGAKGLEAPIVVLADAASKPSGSTLGKSVYVRAEAPGPLLVHAGGRAGHVASTLAIREADEANQGEEYWRKLYVGMTRAEDELYVTGFLTQKGKPDGTWYEAVEGALGDGAAVTGVEGIEGEVLVYPAKRPKPAALKATKAQAGAAPMLPDLPPLPEGGAPEVISPSAADAHKVWLGHAAAAVGDAEGARKRGLALHALLQHLAKVPEAARERVAMKALDALLPEAPESHEELAAKALSILTNPANEEIFGPHSRAEVGFTMRLLRDGEPKILNGRMDRVAVRDNDVLVVDFKSDAEPASAPEEVPPAYLTQLGLYALAGKKLFAPREIEAAIFWTESESLMRLPAELLAAQTAGFTPE